jgi:hypothetical protein
MDVRVLGIGLVAGGRAEKVQKTDIRG